jgi:hypothetical protein
MFGGGNTQYDGYGSTTAIDIYDNSLTHSTLLTLSVKRQRLAATKIGKYALFAGGYNYSYPNYSYKDTVDAYML